MPDLLLDVSDLVTSFSTGEGDVTAVDHISFTLGNAEILGIVGESGSGKSVTALSLLKLVPSPQGRVKSGPILFYNGPENPLRLDMLSEPEMNRIRGRNLSMIFQEPMTSLNPVYTCGSQVTEVLRHHLGLTHKQARDKTLTLFEEVRLPRPAEIFSSFPHEISGGQKQRVMIAMAVACDPVLLIADEPTTALDVSVQKTILDLLRKLQASRGMSILFITHDLNLIRNFASRVLVMHRGRIAEQGTTEQIFSSPQHPYTRGLIACRPPAGTRLRHLDTIEEYTGQSSSGTRASAGNIITAEERAAVHRRIYSHDPVLVTESVSKVFRSAGGITQGRRTAYRALDQVSVQTFPGETLGIVGESGCGKTTLARVILQLIPASTGRILYKGTDITTLTPLKLKKLRKQVQIVFQDPYSSLNPRIMVGPAILEPMRVHHLYGNDRVRKEKVTELLVKVGLQEEHFYRYPHEFSGGQRQRICIARALAVDPELVILDEAVSALDVSVQAQVLNLLNDLRREFGLTYIFISHDLAVVKFMSDRIIVMKEGRIEETAEADELYNHPRKEYTRILLEASDLNLR